MLLNHFLNAHYFFLFIAPELINIDPLDIFQILELINASDSRVPSDLWHFDLQLAKLGKLPHLTHLVTVKIVSQ